jgi:hypothetical protein
LYCFSREGNNDDIIWHMHVAAKLTIFLGFSLEGDHLLPLPLFNDEPLGKYKRGTDGQENFGVPRASVGGSQQ